MFILYLILFLLLSIDLLMKVENIVTKNYLIEKKKIFCLICIKKQMSSFIPKRKLNSFHFVLHYPYNIRYNLDKIIHVFNLWINLEAGAFQHGKQIRNELCNILMKFTTLIIS